MIALLFPLLSRQNAYTRMTPWRLISRGIFGLLLLVVLVLFISNPAVVQGAAVTAMISAGDHHTLALKSDGTVWAWGWNQWGQLGDGHVDQTLNYSSTPIQVKGPGGSGYLNNVVEVSAGHMYSLALRSDGTVWAWGYGNSGQLGNDISGGNYFTAVPVQVKGPGAVSYLTGITAIAAGKDFSDHSLALKSDGTVWAWGANGNGQLGDGTWTFRKVPVQVKGPGGSGALTGVMAISAGHHSLALKSDGTLWAWGTNNDGQLGIGTAFDNKNTPVQVKGPGGSGFLTGITAISAHSRHSLALRNDGTVWGWGWNLYSQLGNDEALSTYHRYTPVQAKGPGGTGFLTGITAINAGHDHSLALRNDGTVWAWGNNMNGRLGDGTTTPKRSPVQVLKGASPSGTSYLTDVSAVSAGLAYSLALRKDGTLWAWGSNSNGKLGDSTTVHERLTPVQSLINLHPPVGTFSDVPTDMVFYSYIEAVAAAGITLGDGKGNFLPSNNVTRGQMAAFLVRAIDGLDEISPAVPTFSDVPKTNVFYQHIEAVAAAEITLGDGKGNYLPSNNVTRGQMAAFLARALELDN